MSVPVPRLSHDSPRLPPPGCSSTKHKHFIAVLCVSFRGGWAASPGVSFVPRLPSQGERSLLFPPSLFQNRPVGHFFPRGRPLDKRTSSPAVVFCSRVTAKNEQKEKQYLGKIRTLVLFFTSFPRGTVIYFAGPVQGC